MRVRRFAALTLLALGIAAARRAFAEEPPLVAPVAPAPVAPEVPVAPAPKAPAAPSADEPVADEGAGGRGAERARPQPEEPSDLAVVAKTSRLRDNDFLTWPVDETREIESVELGWDRCEPGSRMRLVLDGVSVSRRLLETGRAEVVEVGRNGRSLTLVLDRGDARLARVRLRYAPVIEGGDEEQGEITVPSEWLNETTRRFTVARDFVSGGRMRLRAGFSGLRIREVKVKATALDFRARLLLDGGGLDAIRRMVAKTETVCFPTAGIPDDTADLHLVADFRRVRIEEVVIRYDAPIDPGVVILPLAPGGPTPGPSPVPTPRPKPAAPAPAPKAGP